MHKENPQAKHTADNGNDFIADVSKQRELLLAYSEWWDKKYSPQRKDFHRQKDVDRFLSQ
jgi:hypothetical protein